MTTSTSNKKVFPIFLAFICMGFGDAVSPFVSLAKDTFNVTNLEANFVVFIGLLGFGILSIPIGLLQERTSKKTITILGLSTLLVGLLIPMLGLKSFALFLVPIFLIGSGNAIMQVGANPILKDVSPEGKYARNLSFGQFFKAIGSLSTALVPTILAMQALKKYNLDWTISFPIFSGIILITIIVLLNVKIKEDKPEKNSAPTFGSALSLLKNKFILMMTLGIFFYIGAEFCISSNAPIYLEQQFGINIKEGGLAGTGLFFLALLIGRFSGGIILNYLNAKKFLIITTILSIAGVAMLFIPNATVGFIAIFTIGLGFANIFPLIFSIAVEEVPDRVNELSGLLITAIFGGAIIPPMLGYINDVAGILASFIVPLLCLAFILFLSLYALNKKTA